ncbi:hypothetical protein AVEN_112859-1 [Araneus ventricosus]|uniref:Uncharacterized protein n=1 Tax=Araneus ventricosus TaxID=182803 RepID=A0A4Y2HUC5_ARAVE|nr:hypothetical protein AVEN_112859-1 [Araneus ventricosus]
MFRLSEISDSWDSDFRGSTVYRKRVIVQNIDHESLINLHALDFLRGRRRFLELCPSVCEHDCSNTKRTRQVKFVEPINQLTDKKNLSSGFDTKIRSLALRTEARNDLSTLTGWKKGWAEESERTKGELNDQVWLYCVDTSPLDEVPQQGKNHARLQIEKHWKPSHPRHAKSNRHLSAFVADTHLGELQGEETSCRDERRKRREEDSSIRCKEASCIDRPRSCGIFGQQARKRTFSDPTKMGGRKEGWAKKSERTKGELNDQGRSPCDTEGGGQRELKAVAVEEKDSTMIFLENSLV